MQLTSFPPVVSSNAKVLILGFMPGRESLARNTISVCPFALYQKGAYNGTISLSDWQDRRFA